MYFHCTFKVDNKIPNVCAFPANRGCQCKNQRYHNACTQQTNNKAKIQEKLNTCSEISTKI